MNAATLQRGRDILEIFAEAQAFAPNMRDDREIGFLLALKLRKSGYNADEHGRRQRDPAKRAARAEKKRAARAAKSQGVKDFRSAPSSDPVVQLERKRARQRNWTKKKAVA